ncbi:DUF4261 domain-containing protein [Clostridium vincentii]|uniref:DUF4261 domain-containing protein n=1 Tax=Clostridium vincentii TaxID=52704 RepID=A0A2T0BA78_9CLOT|nr:DUF4261 domain-containing protein [Clostridium vincentii]PRR80801.1 hypothetical protein CLVI_29670 [Clostridium vincentii]
MEKDKEKLKNVPDGFAQIYSVELYIKKQPILLKNQLLENIKKYCGNVEIMSTQDKSSTFAFMDYVLEYKNASIPVSITISVSDEDVKSEKLSRSLEQSWNYDNDKESIKNCKIKIGVTDLMAVGLEYTKRMELFQKALYSIVELIPCEAINFHITEQVISREDYLENNPLKDEYDPMLGILNVRLFNIEGKKNEYIMDTLGLCAVGLCDLQCHFKDLNPDEVSNILYSYGYYIFDNPEALDDIEAIEGISENDKWECQHEGALVAPERVVLDINPGKEFSSESRS